MPKVRVGLVGLGSVAQVVHLPVLRQYAGDVEVVAGCDVSAALGATVGERFGITKIYTDHRKMLEQESLDIVAILSSDEYHADCAIDGLDAGCHILVEKPVCLTLADVSRVAAARDRAGKVAMVGYMRRYADAYVEMRRHLREQGDIHHVSVRDIIGPNSYFIDQTSIVATANDVAPQFVAERAERARVQTAESIGNQPSDVVSAFRLLNSLSSHDLSAMRGLIGKPQRVIAAAQKRGGRYITALFDYGGFMTTFETGLDRVGCFDAHIEVFTGTERMRIDFDTPYIRQLPTRLSIQTTEGERFSHREVRPTFRDAYSRQWEAFFDCIVRGIPAPTSLEDAAEDVTLAIDIVRTFSRVG